MGVWSFLIIFWFLSFYIHWYGTTKALKINEDITKGSKTICVNVFGYPFNEVLKRSTAKIGDKVFITGQLGKSRQGLKDWNSIA